MTTSQRKVRIVSAVVLMSTDEGSDSCFSHCLFVSPLLRCIVLFISSVNPWKCRDPSSLSCTHSYVALQSLVFSQQEEGRALDHETPGRAVMRKHFQKGKTLAAQPRASFVLVVSSPRRELLVLSLFFSWGIGLVSQLGNTQMRDTE